jgi:hypothetical protein
MQAFHLRGYRERASEACPAEWRREAHRSLGWGAETVLAAPRMIAQDTGSAIVGPARCDIFFGSGDDAGARAGDIQQGLCPVTRLRIRD